MFTADSIHRPTVTLTGTFGRVARRYPAARPGRVSTPASTRGRTGVATTAARLAAEALAWLADAARRHGQQWERQRQRRITERSLRQLDRRTLRDLGLTHGEIGSVALEAAGEIEVTRTHLWRDIGQRGF